MNQLKITTQPASVTPPSYYLDDQLPTKELVFLDGASGVGKSYYLTKVASYLSKGDHHLPHHEPVDVLYVATSRQQELLAEQFDQHDHDPKHLQLAAFSDFIPEKASLNDYLTAFGMLLEEVKPQMMVLDGLEELLEEVRLEDGKVPSQALFTTFWTDLRQLAIKHACTMIVPRQHGLHQSRSYGAHIKSGTHIARNIITMGYHPINARVRVIVTAKNQRGTIGEQYHLELLQNGSCKMIKAAPHEHARPAKSPATWQADPAVASEENEIIELVSVMMDGEMISKQLLEAAITKVYSKRAYHRTMSKLKMQTRRIDNSFDWYWVPTQRMRMEAYYRKQDEAARTSTAGVPVGVPPLGESTLYPARTSAAVAPQPIIPNKKGDRRTAS